MIFFSLNKSYKKTPFKWSHLSFKKINYSNTTDRNWKRRINQIKYLDWNNKNNKINTMIQQLMHNFQQFLTIFMTKNRKMDVIKVCILENRKEKKGCFPLFVFKYHPQSSLEEKNPRKNTWKSLKQKEEVIIFMLIL